MTLVKWKNSSPVAYSRSNGMSGLFDDLLDGFFSNDLWSSGAILKVPAVNVREEDKQFIMELAAPGLNKDKFSMQVEDDVLTVAYQDDVEHQSNRNGYSRREFGYTNFSRSFTLPETVVADEISAEYKDGILNIHLPKSKEAERKTRVIKIK